MGLSAFLDQGAHWRVMLDLALLSVCRPVQRAHVRPDPDAQPAHTRARIIAANNILNAVHDRQFGDCRGLAGRGLHRCRRSFLFTGLANAVVAAYIFLLVPEYLLRFVAWVLSRLVYRFKVQGDENLPTGAQPSWPATT